MEYKEKMKKKKKKRLSDLYIYIVLNRYIVC